MTPEVFEIKQQPEMRDRHDVGYYCGSFQVTVMVYDLLYMWGQTQTGRLVMVHYRRVEKSYVTKCWHLRYVRGREWEIQWAVGFVRVLWHIILQYMIK